MTSETLNYWMQRFVLEVRKQDGSEYPPLYYIVGGLLRYLRDENIHNMNFLDEKDHRYAVFQRVLDVRMKELLSKGLGTKVRQADPILAEVEEKIWSLKVFAERCLADFYLAYIDALGHRGAFYRRWQVVSSTASRFLG